MKTPYSESFDLLVALISHLGSTDKASSTPTRIASNLGLEKQRVLNVLESFPAFFRKSNNTSNHDKLAGDYYYTLHLRYSRRKIDHEEDGASQPLTTEEIKMLINLVTHMVQQEQENSRSMIELQQSYKNLESTNKVTMYAAIIATVVGIAGVIVSS
ncbi:MAG: hypothetical protein Q9M11_01075 [Mariprofundaceae bacterium]|nr:hypothetical protein [Mariprofundaceae bacterium]